MSFTRGFAIALDNKGRLVLPLEIREVLGIETNGKIVIKVASSASEPNSVMIKLLKASDSDVANSIPFSKNGRYLKEKRGEKI